MSNKLDRFCARYRNGTRVRSTRVDVKWESHRGICGIARMKDRMHAKFTGTFLINYGTEWETDCNDLGVKQEFS